MPNIRLSYKLYVFLIHWFYHDDNGTGDQKETYRWATGLLFQEVDCGVEVRMREALLAQPEFVDVTDSDGEQYTCHCP